MSPLREFIPKLTPAKNESICSVCCQTIRPTAEHPTLAQAQSNHTCTILNLNTNTR